MLNGDRQIEGLRQFEMSSLGKLGKLKKKMDRESIRKNLCKFYLNTKMVISKIVCGHIRQMNKASRDGKSKGQITSSLCTPGEREVGESKSRAVDGDLLNDHLDPQF